jgi:DNA invertase Pin-like site-specific DNA recombinase
MPWRWTDAGSQGQSDTATINHGQDVSMQMRELQQFAGARGWKVAGEYIDAGVSGAKDSRPELTLSTPPKTPLQVTDS